ncbi:MAG: hypothetical protein ABIK62_05370 [candidate division WOR-3 bacterium]
MTRSQLTFGDRAQGVLLLGGMLLGLLVPAYLAAQPAEPPGSPPGPRARLEALRIWRLTEELRLTEEQSAEFFPRLRRMREVHEGHRRARQALLAQLGDILNKKPLDAEQLRIRLDSLEALEENTRVTERRLRNEMNEILTLEQQARLYLFQANFERETRRLIGNLRGRRPGPR